MILSAAISAIFDRVSSVAEAICGVKMTFSNFKSSGSMAGSFSKTSSAAPRIVPFRSASASTFSSTTGPREVFIKYAVGFINFKRSLFIRCRVDSRSGTCSETKSASRNKSSIVGLYSAPNSRSNSSFFLTS